MRDFNLPLAEKVDFHVLAKNEADYSLTLPQAMFTRLKASCNGLIGDAALKVHFFYDLQGLACIEGSLKMKVSLTCERCLQPFEQELDAVFLSTCDEDKARSLRLEEKYDCVELDEDGLFDLYHYLEDCLLLELPFAPRHPEGSSECALDGEDWSFGEEIREENPFAGLKDLMAGKKAGK